MQAKLKEHSVLPAHSGRQFGGDPMYSCRHEHDGESPIGLHSEYGPHGDGWHGLIGSCCGGGSTKYQKILGIDLNGDY